MIPLTGLISLYFWLIARFRNYRATRVWKNVYRVDGPYCNGSRWSTSTVKNIYLIDRGHKVTIIDPGVQVPFLGIKKALASMNKSIRQVDVVLCTHYHVDHVATARDIVAASGARVYADIIDIPYITGKSKHSFPETKGLHWLLFTALTKVPRSRLLRWMFLLPRGLYLEHFIPLTNGRDVPGLKGFKVLTTPGHTYGSISFYNEDQKAIFVGDALQPKEFQPKGCPFTMDHQLEAISADRIARLPVEVVLPADIKPMLDNAQEKLQEFRLQ